MERFKKFEKVVNSIENTEINESELSGLAHYLGMYINNKHELNEAELDALANAFKDGLSGE